MNLIFKFQLFCTINIIGIYCLIFSNTYASEIKDSDTIFLNSVEEKSQNHIAVKVFNLKKSKFFRAQITNFSHNLKLRKDLGGYEFSLQESIKQLKLIATYLSSPDKIKLSELGELAPIADFYGFIGFDDYYKHRLMFPHLGYKEILLNDQFPADGDQTKFICPYQGCDSWYTRVDTRHQSRAKYTNFLNHLTLSHHAFVKHLGPQGAWICLPAEGCKLPNLYLEGGENNVDEDNEYYEIEA